MINVIDIFEKKELTETNNGYKTTCPHCGLQGERTEGFILFPESNTSYCHSSGKWFTLLQTLCLKMGLIQCIEGNDKGESPAIDEDFKQDVYEQIKQEKGEDFLKELLASINNVYDFLIAEIIGDKIRYRVNIDKVAEYIIDNFDVKTISGMKDDIIYTYQKGIWTIQGKGIIKSEIEKILSTFSKINVVNEIIEKIKKKTMTDVKEFNEVPEYKRCVENVVLDIEDVNDIKILPHSKEYNFKTKLPITYDDKAICKKIHKFIADTFYPEDIPQVQEWFGHHLPKLYLFKKAALIHGPKHTGKTVFINLLTKFVGEENKIGLSLQQITNGKSFDLHFLKDKIANIHDDLSSKDLDDGGGFKMAVGDGIISGERKFGDRHDFRNSAKMTFTCNKIPPVKDIDDDAYYDRWLVWRLDNIINKELKNTKLLSELITKEELSGLLNWAIIGYANLVNRNYFYKEKECEEIKELMIQNSNSYAKFASDMLIEDIGSKITKEEMHNQYCHYCKSQTPRLSPNTKDNLGKQLPRYVPYILSSSNGKERYWLNVKFNSCVNMTAITPFNNSIVIIEKYNKEDNKIKHINLPIVSLLSVDNTKSKKKKVSKKIVKKKSDREIQFRIAKECENIKAECTKDEVLKWIDQNPNYKHKHLRDKFGIGSYKFEKELKEEGKIK